MQEWVAEDEIPFMRPLRFIPSDMKDRLPAIYHIAFDTKVDLLPLLLMSINITSNMHTRIYPLGIKFIEQLRT